MLIKNIVGFKELLIEYIFNIKVDKVLFLDTHQEKGIYYKNQISDIVMLVNDNIIVNIEMDNKNNNIKNLIYVSNLIASQTIKNYNQMLPVYQIVLCNYRHFKKDNENYKKVDMLTYDLQLDNTFLRKAIVSLPFVRKSCYNEFKLKDNLNNFELACLVLSSKDTKELEILSKKGGLIKKMAALVVEYQNDFEIMKFVNQVDYDKIQHNFDLKEARDKEKINLANKLIKENVSIDLIKKVIGEDTLNLIRQKNL